MVWGSGVFATYVHDIDPVLWNIFGNFSLRWYGLAYLFAFLSGFLLLRHLARRGLWVLKPEQTADFIAAAALFGVFLGGRIGYLLFYHVRDHGWSWLAKDPLLVIRVWEGGMASHGGILGLVVFTWFAARHYRVTWTGLGDGLCVVAPIGICFGRIANFINGELYGRVTDGVAWAVKFPLSLAREPVAVRDAVWSASIEAESKLANADSLDDLIAASRANPDILAILGEYLPARHPSQIYAALLEGAALFAILWVVRVRFPKAPDGLLTGLFFLFYALFRIVVEQFREPDSEMIGPLTFGQFLSVFMFLFAAGFLAHAWRGRARKKPAAGP